MQLRRDTILPLVLALSLLPIAGAASAADGEQSVKLTKKQDAIEVTIGGEPFTVYHTSKEQPKPYFSPVRSAGGTIITRPLEKPEDHPHHKGVWLSIDEVNDIGFWAEKGKIQNISAEPLVAEGNPAKLKVVNHWLGEDGKPVLVEVSIISIYPNRLLAYDIQLTAASGPVTFGDTKEGLFGIRINNTMREGRGGKGTIVNADGLKGSKQAWGKTSAWVDYYGPTDGQTHGVAIFDHPGNFRKSRYHVRDYGLFTISPFGERSYTGSKEPEDLYKLKQGESLRLRYGLYVHPGDTQTGRVAEVYEFYVKNS